jgi:hypothetical protein
MKPLSWLAILPIVFSAGASAQDAPDRPAILSKLFDCGAITAESERLSCYDRQVAALKEAEQKRDVVVVDRAEIRRTRRSLFGLTLPRLKLFGGDDSDADQPEFSTVETTLTDARQSGGRWVFTLADGALWTQADSTELARTPRAGQAIRIRKGAMGSYLANIDKQVAIRVRRIN